MSWMYKDHKKTGMPLRMYRDLLICPDCGGKLIKRPCVDPDHFVYICINGVCGALFKDKNSKTSWKCRVWP